MQTQNNAHATKAACISSLMQTPKDPIMQMRPNPIARHAPHANKRMVYNALKNSPHTQHASLQTCQKPVTQQEQRTTKNTLNTSVPSASAVQTPCPHPLPA